MRSGLLIVKMLDKRTQSTLLLKLSFVRNSSTLDVINSSLETVTFNPKEMLGILDLRSIEIYKMEHGTCRKTLTNTLDLNQQISL